MLETPFGEAQNERLDRRSWQHGFEGSSSEEEAGHLPDRSAILEKAIFDGATMQGSQVGHPITVTRPTPSLFVQMAPPISRGVSPAAPYKSSTISMWTLL